ncbi:GntR family transcriptional regulator [Mesorhizobium sp. WSM4303]|uniref:GntR family transcriptional regulator n=1 Tax=unclassified Mesorhizobium TaxID=325217 RepID=UPI00115CC8BB|nr:MULTISPECIES: GntR family transcriptional regulator [unclassified Mesorhizobium]TRC93094.1 GntR family transcriptional regulator [Mesorhizobium sp. WSM4306]TRD02351.1 GntR family transcriptional regulator [Mesorhizobium sp. WSM4303]
MQLTRADPGHRSSQLRGPLPVHLQISEMLIREIAAGRLADGARLPTEREMAQNLGIAVGTLRRALADLTEKGLLDRIQGSGNYVRASGDLLGVYAFFRLERIDGGGLPTAEVLSVDRLSKSSDLLEFGSAREAHRIRRLRRLDGEPAAVEEIWLDASRAERIDRDDISESLYLHYRLALGFSVARAEDRISVAPAPGWAPTDFRPLAGTVVGFIERIAWADDGASVEYSRSWFDPDVARYVTRFK